jgi:hypothetical protein
MSNQVIYWTLLAATLAYVLARGGSIERLAILAWTIASILSAAAVVAKLGAYETLQFGVFAVDILLLAFLAWLALRADRFWPLWVTGFHLIGVLTHIAKAVVPDLHPWAYAVGQAAGGYLVLGTIAIGAARYRSRTIRSGAEASWSTFSGPYRPQQPPTGLEG